MKQSNGQKSTIAQVQHTVVQLTDNSRIGQLKDWTTERIRDLGTYIHIHSMTQQFLKLPNIDITELRQKMTKHQLAATE